MSDEVIILQAQIARLMPVNESLGDRLRFQSSANGKLLARNIELEHELYRRIKKGSIR